MYELTKQKTTGYRIIIGIIIFAFISLVLRISFDRKPATLNDDLVAAANEINSHAPIIIDSTTRLDRVLVLPGDILQYNYTLTTAERSQIDTNQLRLVWKQYVIGQFNNSSKLSEFRNSGIIIQAKYVDKKGVPVSTLTVYPNEYESHP